MKQKIAVVLLNLGGPASSGKIEEFLFNLFNDRAIIDLPNIPRYFLAKFISKFRKKKTQAIYNMIGGSSPILELTQNQATALEKTLRHSNIDAKVFTCMRYSTPRAKDVIMNIASGDFDEVILLPLYPQFSTTTTGSSFAEFFALSKGKILSKLKAICCYPNNENFIKAYANLILSELKKVNDISNLRILFSAHGLPQKTIDKGDPYQFQIEKTVELVSVYLPQEIEKIICFQSKVGPLKWITPSTESEIERAAKDSKDLMIVPIAFVSEHSETLVELDIQYKDMAIALGINNYFRIPALGEDINYIKSLAETVEYALSQKKTGVIPSKGGIICPRQFCRCLHNEMGNNS